MSTFPDFAWAVGEESSDPIVHHEGSDVRVDEFAASGHFDRLEKDLGDVAGLGVSVVRYGMPWRLTELEPGEYDWSLWDRALASCEAHGLDPVVDLVHFGLPDHYPGFADPSWVEGFCRYVDAFLDRFGEPTWFTPVNEPVATATLSGLLGLWNDRLASGADYARILALCQLANLEALARIRADRDGWWVGAEAVSCPLGEPPDEASAAKVARRLARERASWDLAFGLGLDPVVEGDFEAVPDEIRSRIDTLATTEHVIAGHDFYPTGVVALDRRLDKVGIADRVDAYRVWAAAWHARYGVDFWVAESSNLGLPVNDGPAWLDALVGVLSQLDAEGLPVRGLCWYSRGDQYDWHTALTRPVVEVTEVGLFDADRNPRPVARRFAQLVGAF